MIELPEWVKLEHDVARILTQQELHGWTFDEIAARELESTLRRELEEIAQVLRDRHPFVGGPEFTPARANRTRGYVEGATFCRIKDLNPTSREHVAFIFQHHYGWTPTIFTEKGRPSVDEVVLKEIGTPLALEFHRCLDLTKKLGMLSQGTNAWMKLVRNGRVHHHCSVATVTHRCAHRNPNLAQVPHEDEFRRLFTASPGHVLVGADLSGIELRMLAHYLARYDAGAYADILLHGDIHQSNADKIGITRRDVKTVTYAFLYGAGDEKIGTSIDQSLPKNKAKVRGKEVRQAYMDAIPGLERLVNDVKRASERGYIKSIDGRKIKVDKPHKALNYLLQSGAGIVAKRWMVMNQDIINLTQLVAPQLAFVHDELQYECITEHTQHLMDGLLLGAASAGEFYNLRIPIAAESKTGHTWAETH